MEVWVCVYYQNQVCVMPNLCSIAIIFDSQEKADKWLDDAEHHRGADLKFWIPKVLKIPIR
jgi:hypothetical protein